jgi:hypothetical protein
MEEYDTAEAAAAGRRRDVRHQIGHQETTPITATTTTAAAAPVAAIAGRSRSAV